MNPESTSLIASTKLMAMLIIPQIFNGFTNMLEQIKTIAMLVVAFMLGSLAVSFVGMFISFMCGVLQ